MLNVRAIKELIEFYQLGISPRRLGQHFLIDSRILERITHTLGPVPSDRILEIGPGLGALTEVLLKSKSLIFAVEKDQRFIQVLQGRFKEAENLTLIHSDVLRVDPARFTEGKLHSLLIAGNIPYSLTSPILEFLVKHRKWVKRAILTIQQEVAARLIAKPGTKEYSSLTLFVQVAFQPTVAFQISPHAFYPQPKVTSSVVLLNPFSEPAMPEEEEKAVLRLIRLIFTHRRKTILNALALAGIGGDKTELVKHMEKIGLDPIRRPETFTLAELRLLNRQLAGLR